MRDLTEDQIKKAATVLKKSEKILNRALKERIITETAVSNYINSITDILKSFIHGKITYL